MIGSRYLRPLVLLPWVAVPLAAQVPGSVHKALRLSNDVGGTEKLAGGDAFGRSVTVLGDLDGNGVPDLAVGATGDDDGATSAGAVWILFLASDGSIVGETKISALSGGLAGGLDQADRFGASVAGIGDVDGDGTADLAVGATGDDDGGNHRGAVYVLFLRPDGTVRTQTKISSTSGGLVGPLKNGDELGSGLAAIGDLDGNGTPDLAAGAWLDDDGGPGSGAVWILYLQPDGSVLAETKISRTSGGLGPGVSDGDLFGVSVAAEPGQSAGKARLAVGAMGSDVNGFERGAVWVLELDATGMVTAQDSIDAKRVALEDGDRFGTSVVFLGDVDDGGYSDLAVGAAWADAGGPERGAVHVLYLGPRSGLSGLVRGHVELSSDSGFFPGAIADGDRFGSAIAPLGDLDGDGYEDCVVGAYLDDTADPDAGAVWVSLMSGCPAASMALRNGSGVNQMRLSAPAPPGFAGTWEVDVDCSGHAPSLVMLVAVAAPYEGLFLAGGEVLIDLSSQLLFVSRAQHTGGVFTFEYQIPTDPTFCAFTAYTQAVVLGSPGYELTNALDFTTGR